MNLQKIATSDSHLVHSQETKTVVKEISSKLCPSQLIPDPKTQVDSSKKPKSTDEFVSRTDAFVSNPDEFVSKTDAFRTAPWVLHDETVMNMMQNKGTKTKVVPSTIFFMGESRNKNAEKFRKLLNSGEKIRKLTKDFLSSFSNDSVIDSDERGRVVYY